MELEDLKKQLDENSKKIINNMNQIHQNSGALEILKDFKGDNKRLFAILMVVLFMWFFTLVPTVVYLVHTLNDTRIIDTTEISQDNENGDNNYIGNDGEINYGKAED